MFAPYCSTCGTRRLLGTGRIVTSNWHRGGSILLRCHCGTIVPAGAAPPPDNATLRDAS